VRNSASGERGEDSEGEALVDLESGTPRAETQTIAGDGELVDVSVPETPGPKPTFVPAQAQAPAVGEGNETGNGGAMPLADVSHVTSASPPAAATALGAGA
jgi:hypothetical protein